MGRPGKRGVLCVLILCLTFGWASAQADPSKPNEFTLQVDFEDVAPNCCPGTLPTCGDGHCNRTETFETCPEDCNSLFCGDYICDPQAGENCQNCPMDCNVCPTEKCGNGVCEFYNETCLGCEQDCGSCIPCGDGVCEFIEDCDICPQDCGYCDLGALTGSVVDLITLKVIPNAVVQIFGFKGELVKQVSNEQGVFYFLQVPPGLTAVTAIHPDYGGPQEIQLTVHKNDLAIGTIFMAPKLGPEEWWVVLRWYQNPADLDLTLFGDFQTPPYTSGVVNWEYPNREENLPYAFLTYDDQNPLPGGPEIIKIKNVTRNSQNVEIWIHNWSKDRRNTTQDFYDSQAQISIIKESRGILRTVNITEGVVQDELVREQSRGMTWWHVYDITPNNNEFETINNFHTGSSALCHYVLPNKAYCPYRPDDSTLADPERKRRRK